MNDRDVRIFIMRSGEQHGPYTTDQCQAMLAAGQIAPNDIGWRSGAAAWTTVDEILPGPALTVINGQTLSPYPALSSEPDESLANILGTMGCGCVIWLGVLILALAGGVVFPLLLLALPFVLIGGVVDLVKKIIKLLKRGNIHSGTT